MFFHQSTHVDPYFEDDCIFLCTCVAIGQVDPVPAGRYQGRAAPCGRTCQSWWSGGIEDTGPSALNY